MLERKRLFRHLGGDNYQYTEIVAKGLLPIELYGIVSMVLNTPEKVEEAFTGPEIKIIQDKWQVTTERATRGRYKSKTPYLGAFNDLVILIYRDGKWHMRYGIGMHMVSKTFFMYDDVIEYIETLGYETVDDMPMIGDIITKKDTFRAAMPSFYRLEKVTDNDAVEIGKTMKIVEIFVSAGTLDNDTIYYYDGAKVNISNIKDFLKEQDIIVYRQIDSDGQGI